MIEWHVIALEELKGDELEKFKAEKARIEDERRAETLRAQRITEQADHIATAAHAAYKRDLRAAALRAVRESIDKELGENVQATTR